MPAMNPIWAANAPLSVPEPAFRQVETQRGVGRDNIRTNSLPQESGLRMTFEDETGNQGRMANTNESVWKVELELLQTPVYWKTNDFHELKLDAYPGERKARVIDNHKTIGGIELQKIWIFGAGRVAVEGADGWGGSKTHRTPWAMVQFDRQPTRRWLSFLIRDENGAYYGLTDYRFPKPGNERHWIFLMMYDETRQGRLSGELKFPTSSEHPQGPVTLRVCVQTPVRAVHYIDPRTVPVEPH